MATRPRAAEDIIAVRRSMHLEHRSAFGVVPTLERRTRLRRSAAIDPGHEHHGHWAAHGRDEGLAKPEKRLLNATETKTVTLRHFRQGVSTHGVIPGSSHTQALGISASMGRLSE